MTIALLGTNLTHDAAEPAAGVAASGAQLARFVLTGATDPDTLRAYGAAGVPLLAVIAHESLQGFASVAAAAKGLAPFAPLLWGVQIGNENDHDGPASWTMPVSEVNRLVAAFAPAFRAANPAIKVVGPGQASGQPERMIGLDLARLDYVAVHPYAKDGPEAKALVFDYYDTFGTPILVTEYEWSIERTRFLRAPSYVHAVVQFCYRAWSGWSSALVDADGRPTPIYVEFKKEAAIVPPSPASPFLIGPGVKAAMAALRDEPRTDEEYFFHRDGSTAYSITQGKRFEYRWTPADDVLVRDWRPVSDFATEAPPATGLPVIVDLRGKLPTVGTYSSRDVGGLVGVTLHYTAGPASQTPKQIADYQTSPAAAAQTGAGVSFPGIAYTYLVGGDGTPYRCWDLGVRTWHSAAPGRNATYVGVCFTGTDGPSQAQLRGLAACIRDVRRQHAGATLLEGHRDAPYPTSCPGPQWPGWRAALEALL